MTSILDSISDYISNNGAKLIFALFILILGYVIIKFFTVFLKKSLKKNKTNLTIAGFVVSLFRISMYIILVGTVLQILGLPITTIVAAFSVIGIAIGLAVQNSLSNIAGGLVILFTHPFKDGDYVMFEDIEGTVLQTTILQTKIATLDNSIIFIPNSKLTENKLTNFTSSSTRRIILEVSISYEADFKFAISIIENIVRKCDLIIKDTSEHEPYIRMYAHGDNAIILTVRVWTNTDDYIIAKSTLLEEIKLSFDENNISIPYPQLEVSVKQKHNQ